MDETTAIIMYLLGGFAILASLMNWNWFFEHRKAAFVVRIFGRAGARILYLMLGLFFIAMPLLK